MLDNSKGPVTVLPRGDIGPPGPPPLGPLAPWSAATAYVAATNKSPASFVSINGGCYACSVSHLSGAIFDPTNWTPVVDPSLILAAQQAATAAQNALAGIQTNIAAVAAALATIQSDTAIVVSDTATVVQDMATVQGDLSATQTALATIQSDLATDVQTASTIAQNLATVQTDLAATQTALANVQTDLAAADQDKATVIADMNTVAQNMATVQAALQNVQNDLAAVQADMATDTQTAATIAQNLATVQNDLAIVVSDLATAQADVATIQGYVTTAQNAAAAATGAVSALNTMRLATKAALLAAVIPAAINYVTVDAVAGTFNNGTYSTASLTYKRGTAVTTGVWGEVLNGGIYWEPMYSTAPYVNCAEFGAMGDGGYLYASGVVSGTDNTTAIQAAIDYAFRNGVNAVLLPFGKYVTSDTLHLGYGDQYHGVRLIGGVKPSYAAQIYDGTSILPTKWDRPVINVQAARGSMISGIAFRGLAAPFIQAATLAGGNIFPSTDTAWLDPAITPTGTNPGGLQQHSPYAAITIDAYSAAQPADHYPTVNYPAWTGFGAAQYNKGQSSDVTIEFCDISGFACGVCVKPNGDGNGDFVRIRDCAIGTCVYCIAVCHTQSRNVEIRNVNWVWCHTFITGSKFGLGMSEFGGPIDNCSGGACYQMLDFYGLGYAGTLKITNAYAENMVRIGRLQATSSFNAPVLFIGCIFNLGDSNHKQSPAGYIQAGGSQSITFDGCSINGNGRINNLIYGNPAYITMRGINLQGGTLMAGANGTAAKQQATNYCGGILIGRPRVNSSYVDFTEFSLGNYAVYYSTPTGTIGSRAMNDRVDFGSNARVQVSQASKRIVDINGKTWKMTVPPCTLITNNTSYMEAGALCTIVNDTMTFTYLSTWQANGSYTIAPGDMLYHINTDTIFLVTAIGAADGSGNFPVTCQQQNNMTTDGVNNFVSNLCSDLTLAGYMAIIKTGAMLPALIFEGDFTAGNNTIANVQRGDGYGGNLASYLFSGDLLLGITYNGTASPWGIPFGTTINLPTNGSPGTVTLNTPHGWGAAKTGHFQLYPYQLS